MIVSSASNPSTASRFEVETGAAEAHEAMIIDQNDASYAFIDYQGGTETDASDSISTMNGDGSVEGPLNYSSQLGWSFEGMVQIEVNSTAYWMPYYSVDTE